LLDSQPEKSENQHNHIDKQNGAPGLIGVIDHHHGPECGDQHLEKRQAGIVEPFIQTGSEYNIDKNINNKVPRKTGNQDDQWYLGQSHDIRIDAKDPPYQIGSAGHEKPSDS